MLDYNRGIVPKIECRECAAKFEAKKDAHAFCCAACRNAWENRRMLRGAHVYDLLMTMIHIKGAKGQWSKLVKLAQQWKREDKEDRDGRISWRP